MARSRRCPSRTSAARASLPRARASSNARRGVGRDPAPAPGRRDPGADGTGLRGRPSGTRPASSLASASGRAAKPSPGWRELTGLRVAPGTQEPTWTCRTSTQGAAGPPRLGRTAEGPAVRATRPLARQARSRPGRSQHATQPVLKGSRGSVSSPPACRDRRPRARWSVGAGGRRSTGASRGQGSRASSAAPDRANTPRLGGKSRVLRRWAPSRTRGSAGTSRLVTVRSDRNRARMTSLRDEPGPQPLWQERPRRTGRP